MLLVIYDTQLDKHTCDPHLGFGHGDKDHTIQYIFGLEPPHYPIPAIHKPLDKIHALNRSAWRWYWYLMGFQYDR